MDKKSLSERDICTKFITPALRKAGWDEMVQIREEVSFTKGRIIVRGKLVSQGKGKRADYILYFKPNIPIALIEAKDNTHAMGDGMQQGLDYAETLDTPFVFASNGDGFVFHDRTATSAEKETTLGLDNFPSPGDLWARYRAWKGLTPEAEQIVLEDYFDDGNGKAPRYYQVNAINTAMEAVAKGEDRILLVMATGTGKTYTAFQIIWRLWKARRKKRILFLADRNVLIDQTMVNDFRPFGAAMAKLTLWFAAVHLIVTAKNGISSVELGRRLGVKQPTAWTMKHKIMAVMARREADTPLSGRVEVDDAYLGGARAGGKRGRGAPGKTPFVAAVSTSPEGRPRKVKLVPVKGFRKREIARGAKRWLAPGSEVLTDGLRCWNALDGVVGSHRAIRTGSGRQAARMAPFKWVNTTLGNIKSAITGTYRKLGPDHAQRYLASFAWRYNRRYQLNTMIPRLVHSAARTQPIPYRALIAG